jgi:hypothetical protein
VLAVLSLSPLTVRWIIRLVIAIGIASFATYHILRQYLRRTRVLRFGRIGTAAMGASIWIVVFGWSLFTYAKYGWYAGY